ncbi:hypothetical protein ABFS82_11G086200 [Erythranthe guttata]|uniref:J domain-containing protein n=1 Tax=Erythranthe guttata TaxID=4155 RepID=A0A022Q4R1_ERYGU|nr:PREDICTED: uncharacterized protein LOC105973461 [Erythranthe guttata]XP_012853938.1 PREDICTED: uncharacterized protein LOC105973461 [Erythranthe guttata]XP_012853939.1 PREDICTED: uncharacterized protein LOC105973461 [Erythranthe guttata]EYU23667.1 hypothetical protein MIMGU_mgv1a001617mg [Erythranthe guttata]|eukprot:XP_012853937.1 PREDICTED: uncharacterized protein LOC105973461 [Erythranthe guttata]
MECNKNEAIRAKELAEKKMVNNDFKGAQKIAMKAQALYPELDNIAQLLSICTVHCSAENGLLGSEKDWYGILQVEKLADESMIKKQYRRLALTLHPDKNRFPGAESAFKLICEANAVLSDPAKKSLYDAKVRVLSRSGPANSTVHHINRSSNVSNQNGAQTKVPNGFTNPNQRQSTQSTPSTSQEVFWTCCPFCHVEYPYFRQFINRSLRCPSCEKAFVGYEVRPRGVPLGSKSSQPGAQRVPPKPGPSRKEKVVPNQGNCKTGVRNDEGPSAQHAGSQGLASAKTVRPEPSARTGSDAEGIAKAPAASIARNLKSKGKDTHNASSMNGGKGVETSNGDAISREAEQVGNKGRKRDRKVLNESRETNHFDEEDPSVKGNFARRSPRKKQHVTDKESGVKEPKAAVVSEDSKHDNQSSFAINAFGSKSKPQEMGTFQSKESFRDKNADCNKEGKARGETGDKPSTGVDTVHIDSDSDEDISCINKSDIEIECPQPEFSNFEKAQDENRFQVNQFWACYDTSDGMPRFYAKVKKVRSSPFQLTITWLEAVPIDKAFQKRVDEELPVGCGGFKLGDTDKTSVRLSFSHQVHIEKGKKRGSLVIYPKQGEVWALFKNWNTSWSLNPENHSDEYKYEIVEVLSDFVEGAGIKVGYLDRIAGFVSLFQRASEREADFFWVGANELYKFSHCVPSSKMSGDEREGVPVGSFELDPASLPLNPDYLYYPSKGKMANINGKIGVCSSPLKSAKEKGKSMASEETSTPKKFAGFKRVQGEMSRPRRSPRGLNAI